MTNSHKSALLVVLSALALAGCGGGSADTTDSIVSTVKDPPPAKSAPEVAEGAGEREPAATAPKRQTKKKATKAQHSGSATDGRGERKQPATPDDEAKATDDVEAHLKELIKGSGGGRVISSQKEIRKALDELQEGAKQGDGSSGADDLEEALEDLLGGN